MVKLLIHGWNPGLKTTLRKVMSLVVRLYRLNMLIRYAAIVNTENSR